MGQSHTPGRKCGELRPFLRPTTRETKRTIGECCHNTLFQSSQYPEDPVSRQFRHPVETFYLGVARLHSPVVQNAGSSLGHIHWLLNGNIANSGLRAQEWDGGWEGEPMFQQPWAPPAVYWVLSGEHWGLMPDLNGSGPQALRSVNIRCV